MVFYTISYKGEKRTLAVTRTWSHFKSVASARRWVRELNRYMDEGPPLKEGSDFEILKVQISLHKKGK